MKILLFINYASGLMHNFILKSLEDIQQTLMDLVNEEDLISELELIPNKENLKNHLQKNDDYFGMLSNGTWYHIQCYPVFNKPI